MVRSGTVISEKMGDASEGHDTPPPRGSQAIDPTGLPPAAPEELEYYIVTSTTADREKLTDEGKRKRPRAGCAGPFWFSVTDRQA
jgi:hypothetical protein